MQVVNYTEVGRNLQNNFISNDTSKRADEILNALIEVTGQVEYDDNAVDKLIMEYQLLTA